MGSASREALAAAEQALSGPLGDQAGAELLAASAQIAESPALLNALSDASADGSAKARVVERLFENASVGARRVLVAAVEQVWSSSDELVSGIEELGVRAEAIANGDLADELLAVAAVIDGDHELELTLGSKLGDPAAKASLADRLFSGKLAPSTVSVLRHLVANPRGRRLGNALQRAARIAANQGGSELATVTIAAPLSAAQGDRLRTLLQQSAGRPVHVTTVIDPAVVGGVRIQVGDEVIDGSVRSRLEDLRLQLAG